MMLLRSLCLWQRRRFGLTAPCVEEKMSEYGDPLSLQVQKMTAGSVGVEIKQRCRQVRSGEDAKDDDVDEQMTPVSCRCKLIENLA